MLLIIGIMLFSSHADFVHGVTHYGNVTGFKNGYTKTIAAAAANGLPHGHSLERHPWDAADLPYDVRTGRIYGGRAEDSA